MKTMPWFRVYHELLDDEKLRLLACEDRWHFIALLCCKAKGILDEGGTLLKRKVAVKLGLSTGELDEVARRLSEVDLIDKDSLQPLAWDERQARSDKDETNAQRQQRYRDSRKIVAKNAREQKDAAEVTDSNALRNGAVTGIEEEEEEEVAKATTPASLPDCPHNEIIDLFTKALPTLAQPRKSLWRTGANAPALKARWRWLMTAKHESGKRAGQRLATTREEGVAWFEKYFVYVGESDFLTGKTGKWACDLGWLVNQANFEKVLTGVYENKEAAA